jgi:hypothetical protein
MEASGYREIFNVGGVFFVGRGGEGGGGGAGRGLCKSFSAECEVCAEEKVIYNNIYYYNIIYIINL